MKKVLSVIKKIFIGIIVVVFFSFAIGITILLLNYNDYGLTQFDDETLVIIKDEISSEDFKKGDLVIVKEKKLEDINIGDEVFAYKVNSKGEVSIELGVVGETSIEDEALSFENGDTYAIDFIIGSSDKVYEDIGTYLGLLESRWGFLFIILVPSFLIFIYEIYALVVEIKYGKDE